MPEVMKTANLKVQRGGTVPADWVIDDGAESGAPGARKPRVSKRKLKGASGKLTEHLYLQVGPGAVLDGSKIPPDRRRRMFDKEFPMAIPLEDEIPPAPPKTAVGVAAAEAKSDNIARVDTRKRRTKSPAKGKGRK